MRLGIIGLSEGNGHPYSWSAIFNGYDQLEMRACPFPVIGEYLAKQKFPDDFLCEIAEVTHIWTEDQSVAASVSRAARIPHVVRNLEDLIGSVDAVLLARDDAERHAEMALPFLRSGLPIYIDKPFALSVRDAAIMLDAQITEGQIFTCSALRFAEELLLTDSDVADVGEICFAEGTVPKKWDTYGIHILEPLLTQIPRRGRLCSVTPSKVKDVQVVVVTWENCMAVLKVTGSVPSPISLSFYGKKGIVKKSFANSFACFKASLEIFVQGIVSKTQAIPTNETLELVEIIEKGRC